MRTASGRCAGGWASGRSTRPSTPAPPSSPPARRTTTPPTTRRPRSQPREKPAVLILGSGPEPDRAGHRVRLLLRARGHGAAGRRLRGGDGQLQPRDRLHRLRHRRPAVLRAADLRGRPRGGRGRARRRPGRRGHLHPRRADAAGAGAAAQGRRRAGAGHLAGGDRRRRAPRRVLPGAAPTPACSPRSTARRRRSPRPGRSPPTIGYPVLVRPSYVLGGRGHGDRLRRRHARGLHRQGHRRQPRRTRCWSTGSWRTPSRSTSTPSTTAPTSTWAASWSTSRRPASTPATRRARCRRSRWARPTCSRSGRPPRSWPRGSASAG